MPSQSYPGKSSTGISLVVIAIVIAVASFLIYYATAFRTITWWNSAECSLAAAHLGVMHPPGFLLGTILGWLILKLAVFGSAAFSLNLFAGLIAAITAVFVGLIAGHYLRQSASSVQLSKSGQTLTTASIGAIIGALTLAYSETFWSYATQFNPYIFTVLLTALILWAMIKWSKNTDSAGWILVIALLFGLDFSVHRTNLLMAPGVIIWMLIFSPRSFLSARTWIYGVGGLVLGLAFHLLIIPMAAAKPFLNASSPDTLSGFWDYVSLKQLGGGFLVNFAPRNASLWDVQIMDYLRAFSVNFFSWKGPVPIVGVLPGIFGIVGLISLWRRHTRLAIGMVVLFLLTSVGAILYFNIPADYFRSLFRHYMPSFIIFSIWIAYGIGSLLLYMLNFLKLHGLLNYLLIIVLLLALPGYQIARNYHELDGSKNYFTEDYALNILNNLPEFSILLTFGDNDTFPLWYFQVVEDVRPDITILNNSLLNTTWFIRQSLARQPNLPLGIAPDQIDSLRVTAWSDTTLTIPVEGTPADFNMAEGVELPDTMYLQVSPTVSDKYLMASDQVILSMIRANRWRRPIYVASTGGRSYLSPYLQFEGLAQRVTPVESPPVNRAFLAAKILDHYAYRGYADDDVFIDAATRSMAPNLVIGFVTLADAAYRAGDKEQLDLVKASQAELMPVDRLQPLPGNLENMIKYLDGLELETPIQPDSTISQPDSTVDQPDSTL